MKKEPRPRLLFPRLRHVDFASFSLFGQQPNVGLRFSPGVTCLAGANGIGKSTFLASVSFALTGRVPMPTRSYSSADEYYRESSFFPAVYFEGRINEEDRATASISVELEIGSHFLKLTRGFFDPDGLRALSIRRSNDNDNPVELDGSNLSDTERQLRYAEWITEAVGLRSFDQFVFLQHFVLTFDESRNLLFWNGKALEAALFIAFGAKPEQQASADRSRREMERADSLGRNFKWQSLQVRKRIEAIQESLGAETSDDFAQLEATFRALEVERTSAIEAAEEANSKAADKDLALANASAELLALRNEYAKAFARHVGERSVAAHHPLVLEAITEKHCAVCGATGTLVAEIVQRRIDSHGCPFCESPLGKRREPAADFEALRSLDTKIAAARRRMESVNAARARVSASRDEASRRAALATAALREFEEKNTSVAQRVKGAEASAAGVQEELARLGVELKTLLAASKENYQVRDRHKASLQRLQRDLEQQYKAAEEEFVPLFRKLAERFIGFDLDIAVERGITSFSLILELRSTRRRVFHQLSESQRFFLDIALRMALAQFVLGQKSPAPIYIDTPEGALDIAYEARAGEMFGQFVAGGHDIVMTANINTSQLLKKLAAMCGASRMTLVRMTEWTDLSEVQMQAESLFREAYGGIEKELLKGGR